MPISEKRRQYYLANRERILAYQRRHYKERSAKQLAIVERRRQKQREAYHKNASGIQERKRAYNTPERQRANRNRLKLIDPERVRQRSQRYLAKHGDLIRQRGRERYQTNERVRQQKDDHTRRRRARIAEAGGNHTPSEIRSLFTKQGGKCETCKTQISHQRGPLKFHIDHVMPLARGGSDNIENIQLLCRTCNIRKNAIHPDDWAKMHGRLFC